MFLICNRWKYCSYCFNDKYTNLRNVKLFLGEIIDVTLKDVKLLLKGKDEDLLPKLVSFLDVIKLYGMFFLY